MAVYDELRREVVVRLVYDGPPSAGKTSTLYSLLERLPAKVLRQFLSSDPVGARTQVFDWLELPRAALKDGPQRLRCQLIAVPGQSEYAPRRKALLALADAVVFVSGSSEPDFPISRAALRELTSLVTEQQRRLAPVGFVLQANKQDLEGALPPAEVARRLGLNARLPVVGSTAKLGDGVHRAFITALRFAAQRARSLMASGKIERTARGVQEAQDLYDQLVEAEAYDSRQEEYEHSAGGFEDLVRTYQKTPPEPVAAASISAPPTVAPSARVSDLEQGGDLDSAPEARGSDAAVANSVESTALDAVEEPEVGRRAEPSEARAAAAPATVSDSAISSAAPVEPTPDPAPVVEPAPVAAAAPVVDSASPAEPAAIAPPEASEPPAIESEPEVAEPVADAPVESEPSVVAAPAASESPAP
ncbi:MAG TPA: ADP-ribosylation factor-like protein, partial [Pirellulales bacterium]